MVDLVICEWMKLKRSKILFIGVLGSFIVPFLVVANDIRICLSSPSAVLSLGWFYEDAIMFLMLLFGPLVMAVVATYLVCREYSESTLKTIFAVPIGRSQFLIGKFVTLFILALLFMALSWLHIVVLALACSLFLDVAQITALSAIYILIQMLKGAALLFATTTPFVYLALRAKGAFAPFVVIAAVSLLNVVLSGSQIAGLYPWTAAYLLLAGRPGGSAPMGAILSLMCLLGIGASLVRFQREDMG